MKHALRKLSLLALMAYAAPLAALAPADVARLEQEVRAAIMAEDYLIAQDLIARLEGAGARATAQPLRTQLSKALEKRALRIADFERQYNNLAERELKPLRRLRQELEDQVKQLKADLTRARDFGNQQRDKVDVLQREINKIEETVRKREKTLKDEVIRLEKLADQRDLDARAEQDQREQVEAQNVDLKRELDDLKRDASQMTKRNADLEKQNADLIQQNKDLTDNIGTLQRKAQQFQNQVESVKRNVTEQSLKQLISDYDNGRNPLAIQLFLNSLFQ